MRHSESSLGKYDHPRLTIFLKFRGTPLPLSNINFLEGRTKSATSGREACFRFGRSCLNPVATRAPICFDPSGAATYLLRTCHGFGAYTLYQFTCIHRIPITPHSELRSERSKSPPYRSPWSTYAERPPRTESDGSLCRYRNVCHGEKEKGELYKRAAGYFTALFIRL